MVSPLPMEVLVDGSQRVVVPDSARTYGDLIAFIQSVQGRSHRVIVSITLDGHDVYRPHSPEHYNQVIPPNGRLEIMTSEPNTLALNVLDSLIDRHPALKEVHRRAAEQMIVANYRDAMEAFQGCFQGWALIISTLQSVSRMTGLGWGALQTASGPAEPKIQKVAEALVRFKSAFDQQDVVRMGDVLQYDLAPLLEEFREILAELKRQLVLRAADPR